MSKFELLYRKYNKRIYHMALGIVKHPDLAENVVQETFTAVFKNMSSIGDPDAPQSRGYITVIARREAFRIYNKYLKGSPFEPLESADTAADPSSDDVWDTYTKLNDRNLLKEAIKKLPPDDYDLIQYKYNEGLSYKEIGSLLGISEKNVSVRLVRVKKKLIQIVEAGSAARVR